jgi:hypothetical protein
VESDTVFVTKMKQAETKIKLTHFLLFMWKSQSSNGRVVDAEKLQRKEEKTGGCAYKCGDA